MANQAPLVLMWVDKGIGEANTNLKLKERFKTVHPRINEWIYYDCGDDFTKYVTNNPNVKIVAIMSGSFAKRLVTPISHQESLHSVYVFCGTRANHQKLLEDETKIKGVYDDEDDLYRRLQTDLRRDFP